LLSALAEAGGPDDYADLSDVVLIHHGTKTDIPLDRYLYDKNFDQAEPILYPGDILMVPRSHWPTVVEWSIFASILSSLTVVGVTLYNTRH